MWQGTGQLAGRPYADLCNACFSAYSAWRFSREAWALYNGGLVYGLIGALIAVEWLWRVLVLKPSTGALSK
ncbi:hypothetical protein [Candidatus Burkholderia verschuerenii]|uniref:hypothetical protein n=1 Tax=Candidatus Burkholderia verschuerenii TaxID=242163 RepID=UPI0012EECE0C|nr:hypothetical protein [Candidatus Burkholderia verschuerenii]